MAALLRSCFWSRVPCLRAGSCSAREASSAHSSRLPVWEGLLLSGARPPELPGSEHMALCGTAQQCKGWGYTVQRKELSSGAGRLLDRQQLWGRATARS